MSSATSGSKIASSRHDACRACTTGSTGVFRRSLVLFLNARPSTATFAEPRSLPKAARPLPDQLVGVRGHRVVDLACRLGQAQP